MSMKKRITPTGLRFRFPYLMNSPIAFAMVAAGMSIQDIARATDIDRRTLLKHQLSPQLPWRKHKPKMLSLTRAIVSHARDAYRIGDPKVRTIHYHAYLTHLIAWGEYIIQQEETRKDEA